MFSSWFLVSLGLLMLSLVASALLRPFPRVSRAEPCWCSPCTTLLLAAGMLAQRAAGGRFTFLNPYFLLLLLLPTVLLAAHVFWEDASAKRPIIRWPDFCSSLFPCVPR